jgi:membrane protein
MRESQPSVLHPRGLILPRLPKETPFWRRFVRGVTRLGQGLFFHNAFRVAPAMAFHFFLSLMPLLVFIGWVIGALVRRKGVDTVLAPFIESLPASTGSMIEREAHRLGGADRLGPLAAIGFFWIASGGTQGLMDAVEGVVGVPRRPWWKQRLIAFGWVVASLAAISLASFGVIQWGELFSSEETVQVAPTSSAAVGGADGPAPTASAAGRKRPPSSGLSARARRRVLKTDSDHTLALLLSIAGAVTGLGAFYWLSVSHTKRVRRRVFPGAALAVGLWLVISWGFGLYVRTLSNYAVFYGSLAAVAVLLVWLWLTSLTILVGAELNAQLEGLRD